MLFSNFVRIPSSAILCMLVVYQSTASPIPFDVDSNDSASLSTRSPETDGLHPRFAGAILGSLATTVAGNALAGAIGPTFDKLGGAIGGKKKQAPQEEPAEDQTEAAPATQAPKTSTKGSQKNEESEDESKSGSSDKASSEEEEE